MPIGDFAWAIDGAPIYAPTVASPFTSPCCATPKIITLLQARPPEETRGQLEAWLRQEILISDTGSMEVDIDALRGACATGCPRNFQYALEIIQNMFGNPNTLPCCSDTPKERRSPTPITAPPQHPMVRTTGSIKNLPFRPTRDVQFTSSILHRLQNWNDPLDDLEPWLRKQLQGKSDGDLSSIDTLLAGTAGETSSV